MSWAQASWQAIRRWWREITCEHEWVAPPMERADLRWVCSRCGKAITDRPD